VEEPIVDTEWFNGYENISVTVIPKVIPQQGIKECKFDEAPPIAEVSNFLRLRTIGVN